MHNHTLIFRESRIHYYRWGRGPQLLLCFHGYGESAAGFAFLEEFMGDAFTILAIDLPYHGQTDWKEAPLTAATLLAIIDEILTGTHTQKKDWWLMGYSMGGRIALSLLEQAPERIARLILLAPDGLVVNPWYWLATQTNPGRRLFKWTMYHPGWFFFILRTGNKLGLVNPSVYKFVANYVDNRKIREELYTRWTGLRLFKPRLAAIKDSIRRRQLPVQLLYGRFDRIIRVERGEQFRKGIEPWCELTVIPAGHQLLKKDHMQYIYR
ncbi:MAG TPA: alpha/beta hydrolase [Puia sp.]|nr:alpha/beta hydrolase [Puia sp.]